MLVAGLITLPAWLCLLGVSSGVVAMSPCIPLDPFSGGHREEGLGTRMVAMDRFSEYILFCAEYEK